jgi:hypothetical protein
MHKTLFLVVGVGWTFLCRSPRDSLFLFEMWTDEDGVTEYWVDNEPRNGGELEFMAGDENYYLRDLKRSPNEVSECVVKD